jgi:hypothetical protein
LIGALLSGGEREWTMFSGQNGKYLSGIGRRRVDCRVFGDEIVKVDAVTGGTNLV